MYIKLATSIMAIYTVTTNAAESGTAKEADTSTELFKRLTPDTLSEVMGCLTPQSLQSLSGVDTSIRKQVISEMQQRQKDLGLSPMFAPALQILGLQYNPEQFVRDFPVRNFNNPTQGYGRQRNIPFPRHMCRRCRGIYGGSPALVFELSPVVSSEMTEELLLPPGFTYYLLVRFRSDTDCFGSHILDMAVITRCVPMNRGQFPYEIVRTKKEEVLQNVYREAKDPDAPANKSVLRECIVAFEI